MKKVLVFIFLIFCCGFGFGAEFVFPPELKWWIDEIQKVDPDVDVEKFSFSEERIISKESQPVSYKNKLYPVFKKWNYYGDKFAYNNIFCSLKKNKNNKYEVNFDPDMAFGIFDKTENLLFMDSFGASKGIDSFCWVRDNRITATGRWITDSYKSGLCDVDFLIYDYEIKDSKLVVKEYVYTIKNVDISNLHLSWFSQRTDYFLPDYELTEQEEKKVSLDNPDTSITIKTGDLIIEYFGNIRPEKNLKPGKKVSKGEALGVLYGGGDYGMILKIRMKYCGRIIDPTPWFND